ncbi:hypothetical protein KGQ20_08385 [Catenulispora sp. NF23]|uniref:Uncharacterized protein n=1 Tax=Catenulispora pinistramenti TaxID=2705254 RepID=A0ABS5L2Y4_9ACTN|nr:hypothetical protein [Catenulispora pinistramenti]MBS2532791.1 hypothetical protein [Catenulispora pinistramenti]MBS2552684.1 hypothetical protein [Catenulispora pinistramenti]
MGKSLERRAHAGQAGQAAEVAQAAEAAQAAPTVRCLAAGVTRRPPAIVIVIVFAAVCLMVGRGYDAVAVTTVLAGACRTVTRLARQLPSRPAL